jgi:hypothetical protein
MAEIDDFAASLLEESKRFLEKAADAKDDAVAKRAFLHAALMLAFCSLASYVNSTASDFASRSDLSPHEKGILLEQEVRFEFGEFKLGGLKITRLEDRILFIHLKFGGKPLDRTAKWWSDLSEGIALRNRLTHPKEAANITVTSVRRALNAIVAGINALFLAVYKRPFPVANRGLQSRLNF